MNRTEIRSLLLDDRKGPQARAIQSGSRRLLVIAGAGSGKTDVMARRIAWWVAVEGVAKQNIVAFTFTERAAEEMKFRIRQYIGRVTPQGEDATLGRMYVGTIHSFCLMKLRDIWPDVYHNYDILDDAARIALVQRGYNGILGLRGLEAAFGPAAGQYRTIEGFLRAYDLLNEYGLLDVRLLAGPIPHQIRGEIDWCKEAKLLTRVGTGNAAQAFAVSAARYYAYLRCRRFLDFSTSQSELLKRFETDAGARRSLRSEITHVVVDEVQDINPVQNDIIKMLCGPKGVLTAVGDHRQSIYRWRGGCVDIMADLYEELRKTRNAEIIELAENFRSTSRILSIANEWARTIGRVRSMTSPDMLHGNATRTDRDGTHVQAALFRNRQVEARWIASRIVELVPQGRTREEGARHDTKDGDRGISYPDIAILLRSATDARTYKTALDRAGIPAVFRAGPDLFTQPEVLLLLAALSRCVGVTAYYGRPNDNRSLPGRIRQTLGCPPNPDDVIRSACPLLRQMGLPLERDVEQRLLLATQLLEAKIMRGEAARPASAGRLRTKRLARIVSEAGKLRRVFPQNLFHLLISEAGLAGWDTAANVQGQTAMFHVGTLSSMVKGMETPGWTDPEDFKYQIIALCNWGSGNARTEEAPLLVPPKAVTISTIHAAKGMEYAAVFVADVSMRRFPSSRARVGPQSPFDGPITRRLNGNLLSDNANYDDERRLMYVALTRAERFLFVSGSDVGGRCFFREVERMVGSAGGGIGRTTSGTLSALDHRPYSARRDQRLTTTFSDMRYFLECPHDFYLRKVLGFAPTIDQTFGYGRGIHNILRKIHSEPKKWARLAEDEPTLRAEVERLVGSGLFYLRYTTGDPEKNMRAKAAEVITQYLRAYRAELVQSEFEPEREFETLIGDDVLVSGAIDVIRLDEPPRVSLVDFKSGKAEGETASGLDRDEMRLQVSLYALGAKKELEYEPEKGMVRYLGETAEGKRELTIDLDDRALQDAHKTVAATAGEIQQRRFFAGPRRPPKKPESGSRCGECDFVNICGMDQAQQARITNGLQVVPNS